MTEAKPKIRVRLVADGYTPRTVRVVDVDPEVAAEIGASLGEVSAMLAEYSAKLTAAEGAQAEAEAAQATAEAGAEQAQAAQTAAEGAQATMAAEGEQMQAALDKAKATIDALETELAPHRAAGLDELRETAKRVHDADYSACKTAAEIKAMAVVGRKPKHKGSPEVVIDALFDTFLPAQPTDKPRAQGRRFSASGQAPRAVGANDGADTPSVGQSTLDRLNNTAQARA